MGKKKSPDIRKKTELIHVRVILTNYFNENDHFHAETIISMSDYAAQIINNVSLSPFIRHHTRILHETCSFVPGEREIFSSHSPSCHTGGD